MLRECFIATSNVVEFDEICDELQDPKGLLGPSIVEATGPAGRGKTEAAKRRAVRTNAIYLPPMNQRTPLMLLREITFELNRSKPHRIEAALDLIGREMAKESRLVMIDEADLLPMPLLEMLRNLNERYSFPIIIIGEDSLAARLATRRRLSSRLRIKMQFRPVSQPDIHLFFDRALGVKIAPKVGAIIQKYAEGDWRPVLSLAVSLDRAMAASGLVELSVDLVGQIIGKANS